LAENCYVPRAFIQSPRLWRKIIYFGGKAFSLRGKFPIITLDNSINWKLLGENNKFCGESFPPDWIKNCHCTKKEEIKIG